MPNSVEIQSRNQIQPPACLTNFLRMAGLRPTRQRLALAELLFTGPHQHVSAEELYNKALAAKVFLSLATVYNTLHQFRDAGLLRDVTVDAGSSYFDTDTSDHHHYFIENERRVLDIPSDGITIQGLPKPPEGTQVTHVDVVVRVRRIDTCADDDASESAASPTPPASG